MEQNSPNVAGEHSIAFPLLDKLQSYDRGRFSYIAKPNRIDRILKVTFLWLIPHSITPNSLTIFRFLSVPLIAFLLLKGWYASGFALFIISAFSDALDGAIARTRSKVTDWGIVYDPLADKLLIGTVALIIVSKFLNLYLALAIITLEIAIVISTLYRFGRKAVPAKTVGKIKMVLQSLGISSVLLGVFLGSPALLTASSYLLYAAVFFALLSLFVYRSI